MKRSYNLGYYISEGFHSIFTHGLMSFAAVFMIVSCLLIMGSFSLVALNLERELGKLERENQFLAFVDDSYSREQAMALIGEIRAVPNVSSVTFITREEAKEANDKKYAEEDHGDLFADLPAEVFRDRYAIHMTDISLLTETVNTVESIPGIDGHKAATEISEGLVFIRNVATGIAVILTALLLIISVFIIYNTIRLGTFTRREEVAIMKMVGATNGFVWGPFIVEGMLLGLAGGVIAFLCQWGIYQLIADAVNSGGAIELLTIIPFGEIATKVLGIFAAVGLVVGTGGSAMAIHKFLNV